MKKSAILLAALGLGFSALSAQTVPEFLNYQGTVTDSAGVGLGDTDPVNRKVLFRVYDAATGNGLIWTEEQTVTISKGQFSVLLGQGIPFASESHDSLIEVFGEGTSDRYLAITVDNGDGTLNASDLAIAPRQRITSTAYSFRAGTADSIASGSSLQLNDTDSGLGYFDAERTFGGFNVGGPVLYGAGGGALGVDNGAGAQTSALRWDSAGNVGIGTNSPLAGKKLHVVGDSYFNGNLQVQGLSSFTGRVDMSNRLRVFGSDFSLFENQLVVGSQSTPISGFQLTVDNGYTDLNGLRISGEDTGNTIYQATGDISINTASQSQSVKIGSNDGNGTVLTLREGKVGIGVVPTGNNLLILGKTLGSSNATNQQHDLQLDIRSGTGSAGKRSLGIGILDNGMGMIQAKEADVGYNSLLLNPVAGNVGIGTESPTRGRLEIVGIGSEYSSIGGTYGAYLAISANPNLSSAGAFSPASLYCSSFVIATAFYANSDERSKDVIGVSNGADDLSTLMEIEVTDYTLIDKVGKGSAEYKKVIAQQVESVYPQAVVQTTDVISDIYEQAGVQGDWVQLATDLKVGERVRLINEKDDKVYEVLEVEKERFRTALVTEGDSVFVFGREVDDFRNVDYEALATLNISATQELARKLVPQSTDLTSLKAENRKLKARIADLEAKDAAREARLAAIEELLSAE